MVEHGGEANIKQARPHELPKFSVIDAGTSRSMVAWFKLAEFVGRGERERAFTLYRLLAYAIPDPALVAQLEGDLLVAFKDDKAPVAYLRAVELYAESARFESAFRLVTHMTHLCQPTINVLRKLVLLAGAPNVASYKARALERLIFLLLTERAWPEARQLVDEAVPWYLDVLPEALTSFMAQLAALDEKLYQHACFLVEGVA